MTAVREFDVVRVIRLRAVQRSFDASDSDARPPRIGDVATVVHEYRSGDPEAPVLVECVDEDGRTLWLADFERDELELVTRPG